MDLDHPGRAPVCSPRSGHLGDTSETDSAAETRGSPRADALQRELGRIIPDVFLRTVPSARGKPGDRILGFRKAWATACRKAGVKDRLRHDCRRTAARNLIRAGIPQVVAMKLTGHETDSVFRRYAITDANMLREAGSN
jgi:integrase